MDIWRMPQRVLGLWVVIFLMVAPVDAKVVGSDCGHSVLSLSHALQSEVPDMGLRYGIFSATIDTGRSAAVLLPEPYSYVLASVGIASLLAMGSIFRKRKDPESLTTGNRRTGPHGQRLSSR